MTHGAAVPGVCTDLGRRQRDRHLNRRQVCATPASSNWLAQANAELQAKRRPSVDNDAKASTASAPPCDQNDLEQRATPLQVRATPLQRKAQQRDREIQATEQKAFGRAAGTGAADPPRLSGEAVHDPAQPQLGIVLVQPGHRTSRRQWSRR